MRKHKYILWAILLSLQACTDLKERDYFSLEKLEVHPDCPSIEAVLYSDCNNTILIKGTMPFLFSKDDYKIIPEEELEDPLTISEVRQNNMIINLGDKNNQDILNNKIAVEYLRPCKTIDSDNIAREGANFHEIAIQDFPEITDVSFSADDPCLNTLIISSFPFFCTETEASVNYMVYLHDSEGNMVSTGVQSIVDNGAQAIVKLDAILDSINLGKNPKLQLGLKDNPGKRSVFHPINLTYPVVNTLDVGCACSGETISIMGENFCTNNPSELYQVTFKASASDDSGVPGHIIDASDSNLKVEVPVGAPSGVVSVKYKFTDQNLASLEFNYLYKVIGTDHYENAMLENPRGLDVRWVNNDKVEIFIADGNANRIFYMEDNDPLGKEPDMQLALVFAAGGSLFGSNPTTAEIDVARFNAPGDLAVGDSNNLVFIADTGNRQIRRLHTVNEEIHNSAGTCISPDQDYEDCVNNVPDPYQDKNQVTTCEPFIRSPNYIAAGHKNNYFFIGQNRIAWEVKPNLLSQCSFDVSFSNRDNGTVVVIPYRSDGGTVSKIVGVPNRDATGLEFNKETNRLYVAYAFDNLIYKFHISSQDSEVLAVDVLNLESIDSPNPNAMFSDPASGYLFFIGNANSRPGKIYYLDERAFSENKVYALGGSNGLCSDQESLTFDEPKGLAVFNSGNKKVLYISDKEGSTAKIHRIILE